jgi:hypothetical protein
MLHTALEAMNVPSTFHILVNGNHGGSMFDDQKYKQITSDFLDRYLRGPLPQPARRRSVRR